MCSDSLNDGTIILCESHMIYGIDGDRNLRAAGRISTTIDYKERSSLDYNLLHSHTTRCMFITLNVLARSRHSLLYA